MNKLALISSVLLLTLSGVAQAQVRGNAWENAAGGVTAGGQHDVRGPWGGRSVGEGGVVTNGDGAGIGGSRGCAEGAAGGRGCRRGATVRGEDGQLAHYSEGYAQGPLGNTASSVGGFTRDDDGNVNGDRTTEVNIGDRTYTADTSYNSDDGFDRDVTCSGC